jgi:hypothetical protein
MVNVYGDKGNRWWVGQNVGESGGQSTVFGTPSTEFIGKPSGYESLPSGNAADDKQFAAAAAKDKSNPSSPVTISVENVKWYNINGPYATQAAANAAIPAVQKADPAKGAVSQAASNNGVPTSWQQGLTNFLHAIDSSATWVRVAKVVIGGALVIVGLAKITGAGNAVADVAGKVPLV